MKATHAKLVKTYEAMGYEIIDQYPSANVAIVRNKKTYKIKTIKGTKVEYGYNQPE